MVRATISGSFNKSLDKVQRKIREFERARIEVLSPSVSPKRATRNGFVFLVRDKGDPKEVEAKHLDAISRSDFLYVVNPEGYVGVSVSLEIGYALSRHITVFSSHQPSDLTLRGLMISGKSLGEIKKLVVRKNGNIWRSPMSLSQLQSEVKDLVIRKGFRDETLQDKIVLLTEEIGELARVARFLTGIKASRTRPSRRSREALADELADCLIYLVDVANLEKCSLEQAVSRKLSSDLKRRWVSHSR